MSIPGLILVLLVVAVFFGGFHGDLGWSRNVYGGGGLGLLLLILIVLLVLGKI